MRLPLPVIIFLIVFSVLVDFYIWLDIRQTKSRKRWFWCDFYAWSSVIFWAFLIVTVCLPRRGLDGGVYIVMWLLTAYMSIYFSKAVYSILSLIGRIPLIFKAKRWVFTKYIGIIAAIACFSSIWIGVTFTRRHLQTINVILESSKLPNSFDGYKIVQISDLHLGTWGENTSFIEELVDSINAMDADLIVFTGDIVNQKSDEIKPFINVLSQLKSKDGVYSILGNHDYGDYVDWPSAEDKILNLDQLKQIQNQMGWKMLNNESSFLNRHTVIKNDSTFTVNTDSIVLIGVENWGEPPFGQYGDLIKAYPPSECNNLHDNNFKILLTHNPEHWVQEVRKISNIDLSLSGHTHAMQMSVSGFGRRWSPSAWRYPTWGGFYSSDPNGNIEDFGNPDSVFMTKSLDNPCLYVNIGSGEVGIPFRLFSAYPEITCITLKKK